MNDQELTVRIPTYWFCYIVAFALASLVPALPHQHLSRATGVTTDTKAIVAHAYFSWRYDNDLIRVHLIHTTISSAVAFFSALIFHIRSKKHRSKTRRTVTELLTFTAIIALIMALPNFTKLNMTAAFSFTIPFIGYSVFVMAAALIELAIRNKNAG